ncbi:MAG: hypothetical protein U5L96_09125 [Owenweeksia sp.]|nr:hypothetical protein [Owenweeksia sp.]
MAHTDLGLFYGMTQNEEILVEIGPGKTIIVRFLNITAPDEMGVRQAYFKLNGQNRFVEVTDRFSGRGCEGP